MSKITWTFHPYNPDKYKKSENRVMFVGADPNGAKKHKIKDMGEWFRETPEGNKNNFYKRTVTLLKGILGHIKDRPIDEENEKIDQHYDRLVHMRFVDFKIVEGKSKANLTDVSEAVKEHSPIVKAFFNGTDFPHYIVFVGGIAHNVFKKIKKSDEEQFKDFFNENSKAVFMPHPSSMISTEALASASEINLNIKKKENKFRSINKCEHFWKWGYNKQRWLSNKNDSEENWHLLPPLK